MVKDGLFSQIIAHGIIVLIYELWNGEYRSKIAKEIKCNTNDVMCDAIGDLGYIRNWIVHDGAVADNKVNKLVVLKWPKEEGQFIAKTEEMKDIQLAINTMTVYLKNAE